MTGTAMTRQRHDPWEGTNMDTGDVIVLINEHMTYKPGWAIEASTGWWLPEGTVIVTFEFWADNSSPRSVEARPRVLADGTFRVYCDGRDQLEVERQVLDGLVDAETHETREFLRFDGRAPFHPHRADGENAYEVTS